MYKVWKLWYNKSNFQIHCKLANWYNFQTYFHTQKIWWIIIVTFEFWKYIVHVRTCQLEKNKIQLIFKNSIYLKHVLQDVNIWKNCLHFQKFTWIHITHVICHCQMIITKNILMLINIEVKNNFKFDII